MKGSHRQAVDGNYAALSDEDPIDSIDEYFTSTVSGTYFKKRETRWDLYKKFVIRFFDLEECDAVFDYTREEKNCHSRLGWAEPSENRRPR